jgi:hypothetical protein
LALIIKKEKNWINNGIVNVQSALSKWQRIYVENQLSQSVPLNAYGMPYRNKRTLQKLCDMAMPIEKSRREGRIIFDRVEKLEPIASALSRDQSNSRNNALFDIFTEHITECKQELETLKNDIDPKWSKRRIWFSSIHMGRMTMGKDPMSFWIHMKYGRSAWYIIDHNNSWLFKIWV